MAADRLKARHHQRRLHCVRRSAVMIRVNNIYRDSYQFVRRISFTQVSNAFYLESPRVYIGGGYRLSVGPGSSANVKFILDSSAWMDAQVSIPYHLHQHPNPAWYILNPAG